MQLPEMKRFRWNYTALAFLVPTSLMLIFMFITSCEPFGKHCMLYSDMFHQYFPFFCAYREALRSGESLLYSWNVGIGMEYLGLISYYLASPLNLLTVVLPQSWMLEYFSLLLPIKMGLASLFFAILLKKLYGKNDLSIVLFGSFYGICAWSLGYNWNIMWMDSFALLPLVALGTVQLIRERKFILYTITLFLSIFINYYVGLFTCIFVFFLFFAVEFCRFHSIWRFLEDLLRIGVFTVLAIGMTAILSLPTLASLQDTQSSVNTFPDGFSVNIATGEAVATAREAWAAFKAAKQAGEGDLLTLFFDAVAAAFPVLLDAMGQVAGNMGAAITPTFMDGLPNLYCGVFPIALAFLFLLSGKVKLRDKLCCVALLLFFILSFIFRQLDYIWHGFHFPNQIPYRFSYLYSFVLLYMAYRAWLEREDFKIWQIVVSGALAFGILFLSEENRKDLLYVASNVLLLGTYLAILLYGSKEWCKEPAEAEEALPEETAQETETEEAPALLPAPPRFADHATRQRQAALGIACILFMELVLQLATFGAEFPVNHYNYPTNGDATASMVQVMKELEDDENLFYRTEVTHAQTLNDSALNYYNGLSTFTSSANVQTTLYTQALGFGAYKTYNRYLYEASSPVTNLLFNLKYLIERENPTQGDSYMKAIHSYHGVTLLENQYYLPLGFLANSQLAEVPFPGGTGGFSFQNKLFTAATGIQRRVWLTTPGTDLQVTAEGDVTVGSATTSSGYTTFTSGAGGGKLIYTYTISRDGYFCLDVNLYSQKNFTVWVNGQRVFAETFSLAQMFGVGDVKKGDQVQVMVEINANAKSSVSVKSATLDGDIFRQGYDILNASTWDLTDFSTTYVAGTVHCDRDGLLYTSIPQCGNKREEDPLTEERTVHPEGNWSVYVDGKKADITLVGDCMIGVPLTKGAHTVEFVYENPSFQLGWKVSAICGGVFAIICLACYLPPYLKQKRAK